MSTLDGLKKDVLAANLELNSSGLVTLTWGNVSGIDREAGLVVIKPSGVPYDELTEDKLAIVDLDGNPVGSSLKPSSDTATHVILYKEFPEIGGVTHIHSTYATAFAQACMPIPCLGTTHADQFFGEVPLTRFLTAEEVDEGYEVNTGRVIVERFADLDYHEVPGVLLSGHGPFTWGKSAADSVDNAIAMERIAAMAAVTLQLKPNAEALPEHVLNKHHSRKHGPGAYYGQ